MAQKFPGPWELCADCIKDANGQRIVWGNLDEIDMYPEVERLVLASPKMLAILKGLIENPYGFVRFWGEAEELIRSIESGT